VCVCVAHSHFLSSHQPTQHVSDHSRLYTAMSPHCDHHPSVPFITVTRVTSGRNPLSAALAATAQAIGGLAMVSYVCCVLLMPSLPMKSSSLHVVIALLRLTMWSSNIHMHSTPSSICLSVTILILILFLYPLLPHNTSTISFPHSPDSSQLLNTSLSVDFLSPSPPNFPLPPALPPSLLLSPVPGPVGA
jgi:hypothetical protein